jgi:hypothetical protein
MSGRRIRLTILLPSVNQLSGEMEASRPTTLWVSMTCYRDSFTFTATMFKFILDEQSYILLKTFYSTNPEIGYDCIAVITNSFFQRSPFYYSGNSNLFGPHRFIVAFTAHCHWAPSWTTWNQSTPSRAIFIIRSNIVLPSTSRPTKWYLAVYPAQLSIASIL